MMNNNKLHYFPFSYWCFLGLAIILLSGCGVKNSPMAVESGLTVAVVAEHKIPDDCWMIINNNVYNLTDYLPNHLIADKDLSQYCGQDATNVFLDSNDGIIKSDKEREDIEVYYLGSLKR